MPSLVVAIVLLAIAAVFWKLVRGGMGDAKFVVRIKGPGADAVEVTGEVPGYSVGEVTEFVGGLELPAGGRIWGVPDGERIQLRFANVPEGLQQRLRNYFYAPLR